jgi:hypothetical protein
MGRRQTASQTKSMVGHKKVILIAAVVIRLISQMQTYSDTFYFIGRDLFDVGMMYLVCSFSKGLFKHIMFFFLGIAIWNLIEPLFMSPTKNHLSEYIYFVAGLILTIIEYVVTNYYKGFKRRS